MLSDDDDDEVDVAMGTRNGDAIDVFRAFAFSSSEPASAPSTAPRQLRGAAEAAAQPSARKRRRISAVAMDERRDRDEDKENHSATAPAAAEAVVEDTENSNAAMTADDEDAPLSTKLLSAQTQRAPAAAAARAPRAPPEVDFPAHFISDPDVHSRNVHRFLERETIHDAVETDSADPLDPSPSSASFNPSSSSSSSSPVDLTDDSLVVRPSSSKAPSQAAKGKYTPLELQVLDMKRRHPDLLLFFEVGYKFRFFGADAEAAAKHLDIIAHPSGRSQFLTASIPTFRLLVHLKRLVEAGYKVGVVRQTESAAQKRLAKDSGGFSRRLTEVYTKATMLNEVVSVDDAAGRGEGENASRYILVLYEEPGVSNWTPPSAASPYFDCGPVVVHLLAFDPITGGVVYDSFDDGFMRNELETRLIQLAPVEVLLPESGRWLSRNTWKLIQGWKEGQEVVRVERVDGKRFAFDYAKATAVVTDYYSSASSSSSSSSASAPAASASLDFALSLPKGPLICLSVLIAYMQSFHLSAAFLLSSNFHSFLNTARFVLLNNSALLNLEVLSSSSADHKRGSLLWLLQHTKTSFGTRLLRHWVSHPLLSLDAINERLDAVGELMDSSHEWVQALAALLASLPDLERGLSRIHYSTCKAREFWLLLQAYQRILSTLPSPSAVSSARIRQLLSSIDHERTGEVLSFFVDNLNADALDADDKSAYYRDPTLFPAIAERKGAIVQAKQRMRALLLAVRQLLGIGYSELEYKSVLTNHYLIEVCNTATDLKKVPRSWIKVNSTKARVRYHTPDIVDGWMQLTRAEELLEEESERSWRALLQRFSESYALFRHVINVLGELDCLLSLAATSLSVGYTRPTFVEAPRTLDLVDFRHPMTEQLISGPYVPNSVHLQQGGEELLVITGPNMGGKSSCIRAIALCVVMAQVGCYVAASHCTLSVFDGIHTRMGARDSLHTGKSTFLVELAETQQMLQAASPRSLLVFDELGRGTSTHDGVAIAYATMQWILTRVKPAFTLLVTHYPQLARLTTDFPGTVGVYHMSFLSERRGHAGGGEEERKEQKEEEDARAADEDVNVVFMYSLVRGVAPRSFGLNVARLAHVDEEVVQRAAEIAASMRGTSNDDPLNADAHGRRDELEQGHSSLHLPAARAHSLLRAHLLSVSCARLCSACGAGRAPIGAGRGRCGMSDERNIAVYGDVRAQSCR